MEKVIKTRPLKVVDAFKLDIERLLFVLLADIEDAQVLNEIPWIAAQTTNSDPKNSGIKS